MFIVRKPDHVEYIQGNARPVVVALEIMFEICMVMIISLAFKCQIFLNAGFEKTAGAKYTAQVSDIDAHLYFYSNLLRKAPKGFPSLLMPLMGP